LSKHSPYLIPACFFLIKVPDIDTIGAFTKCGGLSLEFEIMEYAEGGNNEFVRHFPGRLKYPRLTFSRGLTDQDAFHKWLWKTRNEPELKDITLTYQDHTKKVLRTWVFTEAFPVKWTGPDFDANSSSIATETLEVVHSGLKAS
jgi:phage tail-like protein